MSAPRLGGKTGLPGGGRLEAANVAWRLPVEIDLPWGLQDGQSAKHILVQYESEDGVLGLRVHYKQANAPPAAPASGSADEHGRMLTSLLDISQLRFGLAAAAQSAVPGPGPRRKRRPLLRVPAYYRGRNLHGHDRGHHWSSSLPDKLADFGGAELEDVVEAEAAVALPVLPALPAPPVRGDMQSMAGPMPLAPTDAKPVLRDTGMVVGPLQASGHPKNSRHSTVDKAAGEDGAVDRAPERGADDPPALASAGADAKAMSRSPSFGGFAALSMPNSASPSPTHELFSLKTLPTPAGPT